MSLTAAIDRSRGYPLLALNGQPTTQTWCYGWPNAIGDFAAASLRICQFHVRAQPWWLGPGRYDFAPIEAQIDEFRGAVPDVLLMPRVCFGYEGEGWWAEQHPDELAVGRDLSGRDVPYHEVGVKRVACWQSAASQVWRRAT